MVFLHGYTDSWFSFSRVLPLLPHDIRGIAVSQRGHGDSSKPAGPYSLDSLARDVLGLMDGLGVERAVIAGHWDHTGVAACPTLITGGDHDAVFPIQEQQELARLSPHARTSWYEGVGHSPHWEIPSEFVADLVGFVRGLHAGSAASA